MRSWRTWGRGPPRLPPPCSECPGTRLSIAPSWGGSFVQGNPDTKLERPRSRPSGGGKRKRCHSTRCRRRRWTPRAWWAERSPNRTPWPGLVRGSTRAGWDTPAAFPTSSAQRRDWWVRIRPPMRSIWRGNSLGRMGKRRGRPRRGSSAPWPSISSRPASCWRRRRVATRASEWRGRRSRWA